jgi:hypothetical protein
LLAGRTRDEQTNLVAVACRRAVACPAIIIVPHVGKPGKAG